MVDPSPGYHGVRFYETFGDFCFSMKLRCETVRDTGACISPFNSFLLLQGLETLSLRMERHSQNALRVAQFLQEHPAVSWVRYAGLVDDPSHGLAQRYLPRGAGSVFTFGVKGGYEAGKTVINSVRLLSHLANVGDARSLIIHPASTTHQQLSEEDQLAGGVSPDLIRLSIGIENVEDILWDLDKALHLASKAK
jgi:O-acetylhomoserine (thiol)-lyase